MSMFRPRCLVFLTANLWLGCFPGEIRDRHAAVVDDYQPTPFLSPDQPFLDPERALGPPDGRTVALGRDASLVLRFFREIPDAPGPDLRIYEVGDDGALARVALSADGDHFIELDLLAAGGSTEIDLANTGELGVTFVRVRGLDDLGLEPGFDLDAVEALH